MAHMERTTLLVDASCFQHSVDDCVSKGKALGAFKGRTVVSPFDAKIQSISFDSDQHALRIVLVRIT